MNSYSSDIKANPLNIVDNNIKPINIGKLANKYKYSLFQNN